MFIQTPAEFEAAQAQLFEYLESGKENPEDERRFEHLITYMESYIIKITGRPSALFVMATKTKGKSEEECEKAVTRFITDRLRSD